MADAKYRVMLIEDDKLDQIAFIRMVEDQRLPYDCTVVNSLEQAGQRLTSERFDVIISDYILGDGTALDVVNCVNNIPVILITGFGDEAVVVTAWRAGIYDYLIKDPARNYLKTLPITVENAVKHKRMEAKLHLLSHAMLSTDDCVYITNMQDRFAFVNRSFCKTYGYSEEEVLGKNCDMLLFEDSGQQPIQTADSSHLCVYHRRKDGSKFPVSVSMSEIKDDKQNKVAVVVIARDTSDSIRAAVRMQTLNQQLEKQNRRISELAVTLSEDLNQSLSDLIDIVCETKHNTAVTDSEDLRKNLECAEKDIARMTRALSNFRDVARLETSKTDLDTANSAAK